MYLESCPLKCFNFLCLRTVFPFFLSQQTRSMADPICRYFLRGDCKSGARCRFAHSAPSSPSLSSQVLDRSVLFKTQLCHYFSDTGTCKRGDQCQFAHGQHELRLLRSNSAERRSADATTAGLDGGTSRHVLDHLLSCGPSDLLSSTRVDVMLCPTLQVLVPSAPLIGPPKTHAIGHAKRLGRPGPSCACNSRPSTWSG
jgi:hypothetical protein